MIKAFFELFYMRESNEQLYKYARFDFCDGEPINAAAKELIRRLELGESK